MCACVCDDIRACACACICYGSRTGGGPDAAATTVVTFGDAARKSATLSLETPPLASLG